MAYTLHQQEITNGIYRRLTGADSRVATAELQDLVRRDLLEQTGTRRWTSYRLSPSASDSTETEYRRVAALQAGPRRTAQERQEAIIALLRKRGSVAARVIAEELAIPRPTVRYELRRLTENGTIERTVDDPKDPRTEYRLRI